MNQFIISYMYANNRARTHHDLTFFQSFLEKIDHFHEKIIKTTYLDPKKLLTDNRKDIEYRCKFLFDVIERNLPASTTLFYQFISDKDRNIFLDNKTLTKNFQTLIKDIKKNGLREPLIVGKYNSKFINCKYTLYGKKNWAKYKNLTGYQLIDGGHRLAAALFLKIDKVPVKVYKPLCFEIPNFTGYIDIKEPEYKKN